MGLEQKLSLRLSQRLVMTPTLQQAIKLLQMTRLELSDVVNQEVVENPVLEEEEPGTGEDGQAEGEAEASSDANPEPANSGEGREGSEALETRGESGGDATPGPDSPEGLERRETAEAGESTEGFVNGSGEPVTATEPPPAAETNPFDEIDLREYFGDYMESTSTAPRMDEEGEEYSLENRAQAPPGLAAHLTEQLGVSDASTEVRDVCAFLIGNVDPDGYLRMDLSEITAALSCSEECAAAALALLRSFDPLGVGARGLADCLLIQARAAGLDSPLVVELITKRFSDLGTKPLPLLARQMGVPTEELQRALECLRTLDPKPGRRYDSSRTVYVEPDVAVVKIEEDYVVLFNDDGLPRLRLSSFYRRMLAAGDGALDVEGKTFLREKMRAAQWLMKSLDQRKKTIVRVAESIVKKQRDFLDYGVSQLRPLVLRDVAEDIGMHESTVSRVVSNKWMSTPRGLVPMKFFFHSAITSSVGEDVSSLAVKGKIRALIEAEDPAQPLSDARLAELLSREGIHIARRTVAKYREELRIPSSSIRRFDETTAMPIPEGATAETAERTESDGPRSISERP